MVASAFVPLGAKSRLTPTQEKKELTELKRQWPSDVPSFELWAAATCYDPDLDFGGPIFQKLMHVMLTNSPPGYKPESVRHKLGPEHWHFRPYKNEAGWLTPNKQERYADKNTTGSKKGGATVGEERELPASFAQHSGQGVRLGAHGGASRGFWVKGPNPKAKVQVALVAAPSSPIGKLNFLISAGFATEVTMPQGAGKCDFLTPQTRQWISATTAGSKKVDAKAKDGCVSFGNQLAAFYGLYFYPGCREITRQWKVRTRGYTIRMRLPNPAYERNGNHLIVHEPHYNGKREVGNGFRMFTLRGGAINFDQLARIDQKNSRIVAAIAPFASKPNAALYWDEKGGSIAEAWTQDEMWTLLEGSKWEGRCFKRDDYPDRQNGGRAFGWTMPQALCLWPHVDDEWEVVTEGSNYPGYQPWPKFSDGGKEGIQNWPKEEDPTALIDYFEMPPVKADRQKWALGESFRRYEDSNAILAGDEPQATAQPTTFTAATVVTATGEPGDAANDDETPGAGTAQAQSTAVVEAEIEDGLTDEQMEADERGEELKQEEEPKGEQTQKERLKPGAMRRDRDNGGNRHFYSLRYSPWPPRDLYNQPKENVQRKPLNGKGVEEYREKYGGIGNLLFHSQPSKIVGIKQDFGTPLEINGERILDMPLDSYRRDDLSEEQREVFRRNMRRIVAIYWDQSGDLGVHTSHRMSVDQKRDGMLKGLWGTKEDSAGWKVLVVPPKPHSSGGNVTPRQILPRVFEEEPPETSKTLITGAREEADKLDVDGVVSEMLVKEWLQTPWHYQYLPYQVATSTFKEGETYCAGCKRCSRPFFEYKFLYAEYLLSNERTKHWPHLYWYKEGQDVSTKVAPQPFHDPDFWSQPVLKARQNKSTGNLNADELLEDRGYHNWLTKLFLLGWVDDDTKYGRYNKNKWVQAGQESPLGREWSKRAMLPHLREQWKAGNKWTFREYYNHMYLEDGVYEGLVQGVMRNNNSKVRFGMTDYKLMRSIKYGNTCRDCAATLALAPGLYERTGVVRAETLLVRSKQVASKHLSTWWLQLNGVQLKGGFGKFDPWFIFLQTGHDDKYKYNRPIDGEQYTRKLLLEPNAQVDGKDVWDDEDHKKLVRQLAAQKDKMVSLDRQTTAKLVDVLMSKSRTQAEKLHLLWGDKWEDKLTAHLDAAEEQVNARNCTLGDGTDMYTKHRVPPQVHIQPVYDANLTAQATKLKNALDGAKGSLDDIIKWLDSGRATTLQVPGHGSYGALRDILHQAQYEIAHRYEYMRDPKTALKRFDSKHYRTEHRDFTHKGTEHCLRTLTLINPIKGAELPRQTKKEKDAGISYLQINGYVHREVIYKPDKKDDWNGDGFLYTNSKLEKKHAKYGQYPFSPVQERELKQTRVFITYSLHRRIRDQDEALYVMQQMGDAVRTIFGLDKYLCQLMIFGMRISKAPGAQNTLTNRHWEAIPRARKDDTEFYGVDQNNSYLYDSYATHVESTEVDAGIEIGPTYHMPHFHTLLTINHYS